MPSDKYRMTIEAKGDNVPPAAATFDVWIDKSGILQCQTFKRKRVAGAVRKKMVREERGTVSGPDDKAKVWELREPRTLTGHSGGVWRRR